MRDLVFLVGFMGCGKTAIGRRMAERLGWDFVDTDEQLEAREGRTIAEIFRDSGETHFRDLESAMLEALDGRSRCVVSTGGGGFLRWENRRRMAAWGRTIWLDVPFDVARRRVGQGISRPLWTSGAPTELRAVYERRRACYALADCRVDASAELENAVEEALRTLWSAQDAARVPHQRSRGGGRSRCPDEDSTDSL